MSLGDYFYDHRMVCHDTPPKGPSSEDSMTPDELEFHFTCYMTISPRHLIPRVLFPDDDEEIV